MTFTVEPGTQINEMINKVAYGSVLQQSFEGFYSKIHLRLHLRFIFRCRRIKFLKFQILIFILGVSEGSPNVMILDDGWTAVSPDNSRSAQFEHTVLITETGVEILTKDTSEENDDR